MGKRQASKPVTPEPIEMTPEMIEAGALALARFSTYFSTLEDEAERVFREIMKAAPSKGFVVRRSVG